MDKSVSGIRASLANAVRQIYSRADRAFPHKRRQHLSKVHRFSHQVQGTPDSSGIGQALVSAIAQGMAAGPVLLFMPHPEQDRLVVAASEGWDSPYPMSVQQSSPFLIWLGEQHRAMASEEVHPQPQWQGLPAPEREALSTLGLRLFLSMRIGSASNALLVVGSRRGGTTYAQEEIETLELLAHQAASAIEIAHLRHRLDRQQQELRRARGELASSTGMTAIGEAISASAREIESSLRAISNMAAGMSQEVNEQSASRQTAAAMKAEADHAHDALLPLLDLSLEGRAGWSTHDLNSLLSSAVAASGLYTTGSRVKVTLQLDHGGPGVWCDEERMRQVFVNLIANALDAMPQEGLLTISTRVAGNMVEVRLADTGVGIPPEHLERVFDAFFTSKPVERGSGLGLASSRRTVERHQGTISVDSEVGKGTTVVILLPLQPRDQVTAQGQT